VDVVVAVVVAAVVVAALVVDVVVDISAVVVEPRLTRIFNQSVSSFK
jgi:hypothetical protein